MSYRNWIAIVLAACWLALSPSAGAETGDGKRGAGLYTKYCAWCHGKDGDGTGPGARRLNPPPRDFTSGEYKIKTSGHDAAVPNDADIFRMIRDGMPGTAMPAWDDVLSRRDMTDLVAYLKTFAEIEGEKPDAQVDYGSQVPSSAESIAKGRELFHDSDRCSECHGAEGKGDAVKRLKGDGGERTWPRNLTKPWIFRASNDPKDIFTRISTGIPGTQMPSFADPISKKKLSVEDRWHVANYVASLAKTRLVVRPENTVIKVAKVAGGVPDRPDDPKWQGSEPTTFALVPQIIAKQRFFTPSNDTITVRALYDDTAIAFLLEWDDRTKSTPGDPEAERIADPNMGPDGVAIQLPVEIPKDMEKPYFGMGDATHPVNIWHWKSATSKAPQSVALMNGNGFKKIEKRDAAKVKIGAKGIYDKGTWRVVMRRPRTIGAPDRDIQFVEGRFIPIAFAAWDGSNGERGSKHTMTTWYWLLLEPPTGLRPLIAALVIFLLVLLGEFWWVRSAARRKEGTGGG